MAASYRNRFRKTRWLIIMPTAPDNHDAHDYAERIRERLPRRLQELRQARGLTMHTLEKKSGVSREMIRCIEDGATIPSFHADAKLAHGG
jgi:ribosome-binding protein aMBF1 (putative translation factor)